ncbi:MAG: ribose-phosphate pyrophosphokinase [SAR202 cluster bacterium]|jgi:ribose-phosphate pyrophosphokinase|nr:MAG: ribose-phosphate pyrophosphokinase [SAR202 cluster bacterium]KAA1299154.1 MAG: ribose-phosphate pyrophosphokinase [SAR202 cluster bacterium]MBF05708.1 ribose-phosphate pyrophosphokinase [Chloroflexota bacterium]MQG90102.1 ribose-phosphate pyrophosphokinase [SAR202 cluster bacterium]|tara:strand:- start:466 stop:1425 length:960 start_codon:yes stop_codon:yes gene_type:complete
MMLGTNGNPVIFAGNSHPQLVEDICAYLNQSVGQVEVFKFSNDNTFVRILENVRQKDVFILQSTIEPVNDHIMELLIMIDAAKRASAGRITAVVPFYSYARTDKKDQPRVPITGRLVADLLETAGAERVVMVDLHAGQVQGFFQVPVDELTAMPKLVEYFVERDLDDPVVVATDIGISKKARDFADAINAPLAIVEKRRLGNDDRVESLNVIGDVDGHPVILFDDEIGTGGTMISAADAITKRGSTDIYAVATHGVLSGDTSTRLAEVSHIKEVVITDTVPLSADKVNFKMKVLSVAPLLGEAIKRIHEGRSVGELFTQ